MTSKRTKKLRDAANGWGPSGHIGWSIIQKAREALIQFALARNLTIHSVEYVAAFEDWNKGIGVFVFFHTDSDLRAHTESGTTQVLKEKFLAILAELEYPFEKFPNVHFDFDSDENVRKNYGGSYFLRLR